MVATVLMLPLLTAMADFSGLIGGFVVSSFTLRLGRLRSGRVRSTLWFFRT